MRHVTWPSGISYGGRDDLLELLSICFTFYMVSPSPKSTYRALWPLGHRVITVTNHYHHPNPDTDSVLFCLRSMSTHAGWLPGLSGLFY